MTKSVEKQRPLKRVKVEPVVVGFDPEKLKAPFLLRCGALLIDYIVIAIFPVVSLLIGRFFGQDGAKLLYSDIHNAGWVIAVIVGLLNIVVLPIFTGQSVGKLVTGLRIAALDGGQPGTVAIVSRNVPGYIVTLITGGLGYLVSAVVPSGRALHDFFGGTVVVYAERKTREKGERKKKKKRKKEPESPKKEPGSESVETKDGAASN